MILDIYQVSTHDKSCKASKKEKERVIIIFCSIEW